MPQVTDFRNALNRHGGVGRQYRWRVTLSFPQSVATSDQSRDASLLAITTQTPKAVLGEVNLVWGGREFPQPGDRKFEPFQITFIGVQDDFHHTLFESWSEQFNGTLSNTSNGNFEDLYQDITLELLDSEDNVIKEYVLEDSWPQEVGELSLDQTAQDSFNQFTVTIRSFLHRNPSAR